MQGFQTHRVKLKRDYIVIVTVALAKLILELIALSNSGYFSDELLHIEAGRHLALGYIGFPPMIAMLAWIQNLFDSDSLFINHLFNLIASVLIVVFCGLTVLKMGGGWRAVMIALLAVLLSPGMAGMQILFLPNVFEQLFWIICTYTMAAYCRKPENKYLFMFGIFAALGFLTRYSMVFMLGGAVLSVLLFQRNLLSKNALWLSALLFLALISINLFWQIKNHFPVFHHFSRLYDKQLNGLSMTGELGKMIVFLNPVTAVLWLAALLVIPFHSRFRTFRLPAGALFFSFILLFAAQGKWYYFFPIILGLLSFGAVYFEHLFSHRKWIIYAYTFLLAAAGLYLLPHGLPVLKLEKYVELYQLKPNKDYKIPLAFDNYYSTEIWNQTLDLVHRTYTTLSPPEKEKCLVWGRHYSMAAGINLLGKKHGLPPAFSLHPSFEWVPPFDKDVVMITIGESNWLKQNWEEYFESVEEVGVVVNKYAGKATEYEYPIFLCKKLKYDQSGLMQLFKD